MDDRLRFNLDLDSGLFSVADLAVQYGISTKTAYKYRNRYLELGEAGLESLSRAPLTCPHRTPEAVQRRLLAEKHRHPRWGPRMIVRALERSDKAVAWPSPSTAGALFKHHGLVTSRPRRQPLLHPGRPLVTPLAPNAVWAADFKGQFRTLDSIYCYPLTVTDLHSRFLLGCQSLRSTLHSLTRPVFERLFREYGLPEAILTDNGTPFGSTAIGRLSRLSVWWMRLEIRPLLIQPGCPQQNGCHERMHRTLKDATTRPPSSNMRSQQRAFDRFRKEFNYERPHQALGDDVPASRYEKSPRELPSKIPPFEYPGHYERRRVSKNGGIRWHHDWVNVSQVVAEEIVGLVEVDDRVWEVWLGPLRLGRFDEANLKIVGAPTPHALTGRQKTLS